jgi:hypothetical protein
MTTKERCGSLVVVQQTENIVLGEFGAALEEVEFDGDGDSSRN